ncbi:MAG TPA: hypothetical protein EYG11_05385 [Candidatus Latescibacteria bacterium]|nr:hypothetical protein [Candidatus Latescibacterota bacterium]
MPISLAPTSRSDGTIHLLLSPLELIEKLAALIPPPRLNLLRYHGILAPNARGPWARSCPARPGPRTATLHLTSSRRRSGWGNRR